MHRISLIILIFLYGIYPPLLFAETGSFDPSIYTPIDYKYKRLDIIPKLDLSGSSRSIENKMLRKVDKDENSHSNLRFDLNVRYNNTVSDSLKYRNLFIYPRIGIDYTDRSNRYFDETDSLYRSIVFTNHFIKPNTFIDIGFDLFKYRNKNGRFKRIDVDLDMQYNYYVHSPIMQRFSLNSIHFNGVDKDTSFEHTFVIDENSAYPINGNLWIHHDKRKSTPISYTVDYLFGLGVGRINDVTYSAVANHSINYLKSKNKLLINDKSLTLELAKLYEKLKRERTFDSREARIEHFSKICQWLEDSKISKKLSMVEAMNLLDQWEYAFNQSRSMGSRFTIGAKGKNSFLVVFNEIKETSWFADSTITDSTLIKMEDLFPKLEDSKYDTTYEFDNQYSISRGGIALDYVYSKPIGMKGQFYFSTNIFSGLEHEYSDTGSEKLNCFGEFNSRLSCSWYLNIRSILKLSTYLEYEKIYWDYGNDRYKNWDLFGVNIDGSLNYFISPRIVASISGGYSIDYEMKRDDYIRDNYSNKYYEIRGDIEFRIF